MLKAGALLYAIFITFLLTIISGSVLLYIYFNSIIIDSYILRNQTEKTLSSAVNIYLTNPANFKSESISISPFEDDKQVNLKKKFWGIYELIEATININNDTYKKIALIGKNQDNHPALYLKQDANELEISGNTNLKGPCYVPNAIIRKTYIPGYQNPGITALPNIIRKSEENLPELSANLIRNLSDIKTSYLKGRNITQSQLPDTLNQSFTDSTITFYSEKSISISNKVITGNVIIVSTEKIIVYPTNKLSKLILYAPQIEFLSGCSNSVQCFADEKIIVQEDCDFLYPSCLAIINPGMVSTDIVLEGECNFTGEIILQNKTDNTSSIKIGKNTIVNGLVYSNSNIELLGSVNGSIYVNQFKHKIKSEQFTNHLIHASINLYNLSDYFMYSSLFENNAQLEIIKWLN